MKNNLPKGITTHKRNPGKYIAQFWDTNTKFNKVIGAYDTVEDAVKARNEFAKLHKKGLVKVEKKVNKFPKGINKKGNKYVAQLLFLYGKNKEKTHKSHIGSFSTIEEAYKARIDFIDSLK